MVFGLGLLGTVPLAGRTTEKDQPAHVSPAQSSRIDWQRYPASREPPIWTRIGSAVRSLRYARAAPLVAQRRGWERKLLRPAWPCA